MGSPFRSRWAKLGEATSPNRFRETVGLVRLHKGTPTSVSNRVDRATSTAYMMTTLVLLTYPIFRFGGVLSTRVEDLWYIISAFTAILFGVRIVAASKDRPVSKYRSRSRIRSGAMLRGLPLLVIATPLIMMYIASWRVPR